MSEKRIHTLSHNARLADAGQALQHISALREIHLNQRGYVGSRGLDPEIFLPGNIWADLDHRDSYFPWTPNKIDLVRALSPFSGFHLPLWARQDSAAYDAAIAAECYGELFGKDLTPEQADAILEERFTLLEKIEQSREGLIESWRALTQGVPEQFHVRAPAIGGEIGVWWEGRILNPDILSYQSRINALYASGALAQVARAIEREGVAHYLEIGPGACTFAYMLRSCFDGHLQAHLIDLPAAQGNGCAYLSCAAGPESVAVATPQSADTLPQPYVMLSNALVPWYESRLPKFHLAHNAISLNEMSSRQVDYYLDLIARVLAPNGLFHLSEGRKLLDYHTDAQAAAVARFPSRVFEGKYIGSVELTDYPNTITALTADALP